MRPFQATADPVAYQQRVAALRQRLGPHPFAHIPGMSELEVIPDQPTYNPFTGRWIE